MTRFIGIIGYPLKHSLSPIFQQAALDHYGLDIRYEVWETPPAKFASIVDRLKQPQVIGANVTVPYKQKILEVVDKLDKTVNIIGAANTIYNRNGKLEGYNTDAKGFLQSLREESKFDPKGKQVAIIGAGGAARAICFALLHERVDSLTIMNRTLRTADDLVESLQSTNSSSVETTKISSSAWLSSQFHERLLDAQLIVNCTTIGMLHSLNMDKSPIPFDWIPQNALVCDLVYNPLETPLLQAARKAGANVLNGSYMLLYQGAASFQLWTGRQAPLDVMLKTIQKALS